MFKFEWKKAEAVGCVYLLIGDLPYREVKELQNHVTGTFHGIDEGGITEDVPMSFTFITDVVEKVHFRDSRFMIDEYNERTNQIRVYV